MSSTGGENRTPAKGFGDPRSTTKLHPPSVAVATFGGQSPQRGHQGDF